MLISVDNGKNQKIAGCYQKHRARLYNIFDGTYLYAQDNQSNDYKGYFENARMKNLNIDIKLYYVRRVEQFLLWSVLRKSM